jgi:pimeloyl-ACP methyl ester carboxylesterase
VVLQVADPFRLEDATGSGFRGLQLLLAVTGAVAAVALFRRSGRLLAGLLALVVGALALGWGGGTAGMHLLKGQVFATTYAGALSLAAGGALVAQGTVLWTSEIRGWKRLVALPLWAFLFVYVVAPISVAVYVTHVPRVPLTGLTPADKGLVYREVSVSTRDGVNLRGWYVPSRNGAAVMVMHGSSSNRSHMIDHVAALGHQGYGVLALDARGHGRSGGAPMDFGWLGANDADAGVTFLADQPEVDPGRIGIIGFSMGSTAALNGAAADPRIRAVISEGVSVSSFADVDSLGPGGWPLLPSFWLCYAAADLMSPASPPLDLEEAVTRIAPRPLLLISGNGQTEAALNRRYAELTSPTTTLWELPDTEHTRGIWTHPDRWARRVGDFLDRTLLG